MQALVASARSGLLDAGIPAGNIAVYHAAGSFEVPLIGAELAEQKAVDALIGLGIIVQGETDHARLLSEQAARGIMDVQLRYRIPFAFEILTVPNISLARERLDKGAEAAVAVLYSLFTLQQILQETAPLQQEL